MLSIPRFCCWLLLLLLSAFCWVAIGIGDATDVLLASTKFTPNVHVVKLLVCSNKVIFWLAHSFVKSIFNFANYYPHSMQCIQFNLIFFLLFLPHFDFNMRVGFIYFLSLLRLCLRMLYECVCLCCCVSMYIVLDCFISFYLAKFIIP